MPEGLGEFILAHEGLPHDLAQSGMKGELPTVHRLLRALRPGDPSALRARLARLNGISADRVVLTTGATTANSLVLLYLLRRLRKVRGRTPRAGLRVPEYPPLWDVAEMTGFRTQRGYVGADLAVLSNPNNPEGHLLSRSEVAQLAEATPAVVVDETFREFTRVPSVASLPATNLWTLGSFTKVYGADDIRVGYVIAPAIEVASFRSESLEWVDRVAPASVGGALAILDRRQAILRESRGRFQANLAALQRTVPGVPRLFAPVWFDRHLRGQHPDALVRRGLARGILLSSGRHFRDRSGMRICLTRRSFPADLRAYLELRDGHPRR